MFSFLFTATLIGGLANMSMIPIIMQQRDVFYKQSDAYFYPTLSFVLTQSLVLIPMQILEMIIFALITYWSVGLSSANDSVRFFMLILIGSVFSVAIAQLFRAIGALSQSAQIAQPLAGISTVLMVLFSGYIQPKAEIPDGWIW